MPLSNTSLVEHHCIMLGSSRIGSNLNFSMLSQGG